MKRTALTIVLLSCFPVLNVARSDDTADSWREMQRSTLKGAKAVYVSTAITGPVKDPAGMTDREMTNFVSLELRKHGIPLSVQPPDAKSLGEVLPMTIMVTVSNEVDIPGQGKFTALHMRLVVHQFGSVSRLPDKRVIVVTWESTPSIGVAFRGVAFFRDQARNALTSLAEEFASDYLAANDR